MSQFEYISVQNVGGSRNISAPHIPFPGLDFALSKGQGRLYFHSEFYFTLINSTKAYKE